MTTISTSQSSNQPTKQQRDYLRQHLTVNGATPDEATLTHILNAKPKQAPKGNPVTTRAFSLLR